MGQTLTHGIYLPDEGERNCYNGLAANWSILDGAVGTIAEHTSALSGKAPLVHTHTKADITDFPALANVATSGSYNDLSNIPASFTPASHTHGNLTNDGKVGTTANVPLITGTDGVVQAGSFGNSANTFCEGNDSRLSDARTPVAHTHTKSDVTDLFNSANTWSGEQTFSQTIQGNAATASEFASNQSVTLTGTIEGTASSKAGWTIATDFREGRGARTTTDFYAKLASGSFSGGWNVYVATFMCNASERFETALIQICFVLNNSGVVDTSGGVQLRIKSIHGFRQTRFVLVWKNDTNKVLFELYAYNPSANQGVLAQLLNEFIRNGNKQSINIQMHSNVVVNALPDGYTVVNAETALTANDFIPSANNSYDLGTSTNKWKTLNGVNPGALSFPNYDDTTYIDISGSIVPPSGQTTINYSGGENQYTPPVDGWLSIRCDGATFLQIYRNAYNCPGTTASRQDASGKLVVTLPVLKNKTYTIKINTSGTTNVFQLYPCLGNV